MEYSLVYLSISETALVKDLARCGWGKDAIMCILAALAADDHIKLVY